MILTFEEHETFGGLGGIVMTHSISVRNTLSPRPHCLMAMSVEKTFENWRNITERGVMEVMII